MRADVGGRDVTAQLQVHLRRAGHAFHTSAEMELLRAVKETACYVARSPSAEEAAWRAEVAGAHGGGSSVAEWTAAGGSSGGGGGYLLPDGSRLHVGAAAFRASEVLFQPALAGVEAPGAHEAVAAAVAAADLALRGTLLSNIVLAGGASATRGFGERLLAELRRGLPPGAHVKIWAPAERKVLTWVGGSILASLTTFRNMCVSREAWEEEGPRSLARMACV